MNELINKILENGFKYNAVNYWCGNVRIKKNGGVLEIYTEDNVCFELNKDKLLNGIKEYCSK